MSPLPPSPNSQTGWRALQAMIRQRGMLAALQIFQQELGNVFRINLPGFNPVVLVGPEANRFVLVTHRDELRWRAEHDPITRLLRDGLLVIDGDWHDAVRGYMNPAFHRRMLAGYVEAMWYYTDQVSAAWDASPRDMLAEIRRMTLLILIQTMFKVDFSPEMGRLWPEVLRLLAYISPGLWLLWRDVPRPGYARARQEVDHYLYRLIQARREALREANDEPDDLLGVLLTTPDMSDDLIRDQMLTMLIAGHDTSTALLAWALYLLGRHPAAMAQARAEVESVLGCDTPALEHMPHLRYLEQVINEALRLYPPLHIGTRTAAVDLEFQGYCIPAGTRVLYSPYLTHRLPEYWPDPDQFDPERFSPEQTRTRPPYSFVPFGGGSRICIGAAFAQVEAKVVLARLLQQFELELIQPKVYLHMGVTLEPRPGVMMRAQRKADKK
ncbi:MAG: cytochrome P450 [Anaerolineae bacterium]|nr:cytochrome P450 [Anaerolineae bacterium]